MGKRVSEKEAKKDLKKATKHKVKFCLDYDCNQMYDMTDAYMQPIKDDLNETIDLEDSYVASADCAMPEGSNVVGLYEWVPMTDNGKAYAFSKISVCSTSTPKCPPGACKDEICQECTDDWKK